MVADATEGEAGDRLPSLAARRTVRLTTRGRKSGRERSVTLWFVPAGPDAIYVQHTSRAPAQWYLNLVADPAVRLDFGDGQIEARAEPIHDSARVREVLRLVRKKYWAAWLIQLLGRSAEPVAAEIRILP